MAFTSILDGTTADAEDLMQVVDALSGTAGKGQPINLTALSDDTNFSLSVRNQNTTNSRAFRTIHQDGTVQQANDASGVTFSTAVNLSTRLQVSGGSTFGAGITVSSGTLTVGTMSISSANVVSSATLGAGSKVTLGADATGDIWYRNSSGELTRLAVGSSGYHLKSSGGLPVWTPAALEFARVTHSASATLSNGVWTGLDFNTDVFDASSMHSTGANSSQVVAPTAGIYQATANVQWSSNSSGSRGVRIVLNDVTVIGQHTVHASSAVATDVHICALYRLSTGDYLVAQARVDQVDTLGIQVVSSFSPTFSVMRLST